MKHHDFKLGNAGAVGRALTLAFVPAHGGRIIVILVAWLPLLVLSWYQGNALGSKTNISFLLDPVPYARFMVALPLFMIAQLIVNRRLSVVVDYLWNSGLIVGEDLESFSAARDQALRLCRTVPADIVILVCALAASLLIGSTDVHDGFSTWFAYDQGEGQQISLAGWWYTIVSLPLYLFLLFGWVWRVALWWRFLWKISHLDLKLVPSHPDRAGGLGILEIGQFSFSILVVITSVVLAAELADVKIREGVMLVSMFPTIVAYVVIAVLFIVGPLLIFSSELVKAKRQGLIDYGDLACDLFGEFGNKWLKKDDAEQRKLLGNPDPSSLADYGYAYEVVDEMRVVPFSLRSMAKLVAAAIIPFAPLLLMEHSAKEIAQRLVSIVG